MCAMEIMLHTQADIQAFVNLANRHPYTIELRQGRAVTDAKSILGIYSLDLTRPMTVEIYSNQPDDLIDALHKYAA